MQNIPIPKEPLKVSLVGAGSRMRNQYCPIFPYLKDWIEVVAVCDPVEKHRNEVAQKLGVKGYADIHELVRDKPMEASLVVTPIPSHHSISVYLSSNGIHNMCETTWCSLVMQAKDMIKAASENNVIVRVAENFFRFSIDRFSHTLRDSRYLGRIGRIFSYNDHTSYHNNSRWIAFAQHHPIWVQSIDHTMPTIRFCPTPERYYEKEHFEARYYYFPDDLLVIDSASNVKGFLGRHPRPGYNEWQGEYGTLIYQPDKTELRYCSERQRYHDGDLRGKAPGRADEIYPVRMQIEDNQWMRTYCETKQGLLEYVNPFRMPGFVEKTPGYSCSIMDHIIDFTLAVKGVRESEFDEQDAMMSLIMDMASKESALNEGKRIKIPLEDDLEIDVKVRRSLKKQLGVDPMDTEGMLAISYPKP